MNSLVRVIFHSYIQRNGFANKIIPSFSTLSFAIISNASLNEAFPSWNTSTNETYAITPDADARQKHEHCLSFLKIIKYHMFTQKSNDFVAARVIYWPINAIRTNFFEWAYDKSHFDCIFTWNLLFVNWIKYCEGSNKRHKSCCGCQRKPGQRLFIDFSFVHQSECPSTHSAHWPIRDKKGHMVNILKKRSLWLFSTS